MKYYKTYMEVAEVFAKNSYSTRKQVGAVAVKNGNIIAHGWNGMPSGFDNTCETNGITNPEVLHAELNCIAKLAKGTESSEGCTLFVTLSPCIQCAKLIIQAGIKEVIYKEEYRELDGVQLLLKAGIDARKYNEL